MSIQLDHTVDLNHPDVLFWISSGAGGGKPFKENVDDNDLRDIGLEPVSGSERQVSPVQNQLVKHITAINRHYDIIKIADRSGRPRKLNSITAQILVTHSLTVGIESILYVASSGITPKARQLIDDAYSQFSGQDPILFIAEKINTPEAKKEGLTTDHFHIVLRFTLAQNRSPVKNLDQVNALENLYRGQGGGVAGDQEWFQKENLELRHIRDDPNTAFENPPVDPVRQQDAKERLPEHILDEVAREVAGDLDCDDYYEDNSHPVMTLLAWPEFKLEWYTHTIKIGCSRIKIKLPRLLTRTAEIVLYATVAVARRDVDDTLMRMIGECAVGSALVGGVVGVVMANFAAALAAFKALFERCIYIKLGQHVACLVPELVLITVKGEWS